MAPVTAAAAAISALLGLVAVLGVCVVWLRRSISTERDQARVNTIAALRELDTVKGELSDAQLADERAWSDRLERHHVSTHRRCQTGPVRDG